MLSVIYKPCMLSDFILNVVMLNVVAPSNRGDGRSSYVSCLRINVYEFTLNAGGLENFSMKTFVANFVRLHF